MHRVLWLIKGLGRGGAEQLLASAAPYLDRSKFSYEVAYLLPHKDALANDLASAGLPVTCLQGGGVPSWVSRLKRLVQRHDIDLVHAHSPVAAAGARYGLSSHKRPAIVYTEHNLWDRYHRATRLLNMATYARNDHVFAVSDDVRRSISYPRLIHNRTMPPSETLYHGPDHAALAASEGADGVRRELDIPENAPLIGVVANFKEHKGHRYALLAAATVVAERPAARFLLVGLGPLQDDMRSLARSLGIENNVVFAGFRQDVPRIVRTLDLFLLPSTHEGLPIALVEAMALGVPAVAAAVGGIPEVIEHDVSGLLVEPRDPTGFANAILALLADQPRRSRMGMEAARRARDFDIRNAVARTETVYEELLS